MPDRLEPRGSVWEVERDRHGVMFSGPLEVGECRRVVDADELDARAPRLDADEQAIMDHILAAMRGIIDLGLKPTPNLRNEMAGAVHVLQGFVVQHMLQRLAPDEWGSWYEPAENQTLYRKDQP